MKILVINGSPKGNASNTLQLTRAFLEGMGEAEVRQISVAASSIAGCKGCFCCWNKTPGKCVIKDDMKYVLESELWADVILWSFPLYYFSVPGGLKNLIDRQLPLSFPFMKEREDGTGSGSHPSRYDMSGKKHVIISTCGFYSAKDNYDSVKLLFDHMCGKDAYEMITCGQGELFRVPELKERTNAYLEVVRQAGVEFVNGDISSDTRNKLSQLLYPKEVFEKMADASWGIEQEGTGKVDETLSFTRQMAALYNKDAFDGKERVLEIAYTDRGKTYQIVLGKEGSQVIENATWTPTTRIETPWKVWTSIARGEMQGDAALMQGLYKVYGDMDLMVHWGRYFQSSGASKAPAEKESGENEKKKPSMLALLLPWMTFWIALSINGDTGPVITLLVCALTPLLFYRQILTVYDVLTLGIVGVLSAGAAFFDNAQIWMILGYLAFGLLWLLSCFTKEPLCAAYVKYNYNGERALQNPIFMKTNYILAAAWGILYICLSSITLILYSHNLQLVSMILNNTAPVCMGLFTVWFEKWYPARIAAGK